ncbi:MAG: hypothetical protein AAF292_06485 [Pseudomonadota bacterium]
MALNCKSESIPERVDLALNKLIALFLAVTLAALCIFPAHALPVPDGEYFVGMRTFELTDDSRYGVLGRPDHEPRKLLIHVWYPTESADENQRRPYFTDAEIETSAAALGRMRALRRVLRRLKRANTNSYYGAPVASVNTPWPTLIYSHGFNLLANQNTALMEHLASHGYIIYAIQHPVDAADTIFADGQVIPFVSTGNDQTTGLSREELERVRRAYKQSRTSPDLDERLEARLTFWDYQINQQSRKFRTSAKVWLDDRRFVIDALSEGRAPASIADLVSASDFSRSGHFGMSRGGSSAAAFCLVDDRCVASVNMDGGDSHLTPFATTMPTPLLMLHQDQSHQYRQLNVQNDAPDHWSNDFSYEAFADAGSTTVTRISFKGFRHLSFTDYPWFVQNPAGSASLGQQSGTTIIDIQNDFVRSFFDKHMRGIDTGFPDRQLNTFPDIAVLGSNETVAVWWQSKEGDEQEQIANRIAELKARTEQLRAASQ